MLGAFPRHRLGPDSIAAVAQTHTVARSLGGNRMRTIAILFALVVIGAAAPLASMHHGTLPTAILLFTGAVVTLQSACLTAGWLLYERRISSRTASRGPIDVPVGAPAAVPS